MIVTRQIRAAALIKIALLGLLLSAATACDNQKPALRKIPADGLILAFGDSLTYGSGASNGHDYPSVLAQLTGRQVVNEGIPGEISAEASQRLPELLDEYQPALLILIHGGNDILRKVDNGQTKANLSAMVAAAKQRGIDVVMLGVPSFNLLFLHSADFYAEVAQSEGIPIDLDALPSILADNGLKSDTIHPNDNGYQKLAERIASLLQQNGAL